MEDISTSALPLWERWNKGGGPRYPHEKAIQFCFRHFPSAVRASTSALDFGCGSGVNTIFLAREGFYTSAFDVAASGVANTQKHLAELGLCARVERGNACDVPFESAAFELILCIGVLECLEEEDARCAIKEARRLLKEGGRALFLFAAEGDFRLQQENPFKLRGSSRDYVEKAFDCGFQHIWIDHYETTYEGGRLTQRDWLVTLVG